MAYLTLFCRKIQGKIPTYGEGGVKPVGPNSQLLPNFFSGAPLNQDQKYMEPNSSGRRQWHFGLRSEFMSDMDMVDMDMDMNACGQTDNRHTEYEELTFWSNSQF